jgi:hypothetical protein
MCALQMCLRVWWSRRVERLLLLHHRATYPTNMFEIKDN